MYKIWMEGYQATGECSGAQLIGLYKTDTFDEAISRYVEESLEDKRLYSFTNGKHYIWGCQLFDNEIDARKSFG